MLETQTQIIGAGMELTAAEMLVPACEVSATGVISVCLCDQQPSDETLFDRQFGNWRLCKTHDNAVKLESMNGLGVMLYAVNEHDSIEPICCQREHDFTAIAKEIVSRYGLPVTVQRVEAILRREFA